MTRSPALFATAEELADLLGLDPSGIADVIKGLERVGTWHAYGRAGKPLYSVRAAKLAAARLTGEGS